MSISNALKSKISYRHKDQIHELFENYVHGELGIDHFSLNVFFGNGQNIFLSPTPGMAEELCKNDLVNEDSNYDPKVYENYSLYPWRSVQKNETDRIINFIKEEKYRMRSGIMIVRDLGKGRHVMYSVATHKIDNPDLIGQFYFLFHCKANYIAQLGDFLYDNLRDTINQYGNEVGVIMPKMNNFQPVALESSFCTDEQIELYEAIESGRNIDLASFMKNKRDRNFLRLIDGGKIRK